MFPALIRKTASLSWSRDLTSNNVSPTSYLKGSMISYLLLCASKSGICVRSFSFKRVACVLSDILPPSCSSFDLHSFESLNMCSDWFSDWCVSSMEEISSANAMASGAKSKICFDSVCIRYLSLKCVRHCLWHAASIAIMFPDDSFAKIRVSRILILIQGHNVCEKYINCMQVFFWNKKKYVYQKKWTPFLNRGFEETHFSLFRVI